VPSSRGIYNYLCNGEPSGIQETWECEQSATQRHITSIRHARPVGIRLRVSSLEVDGVFQNCRIHWRQELSEGSRELSADYCFDDSGIRVHVHDGQREVQLQESASQYLFSPLMRIYNGGVLRGLLAAGGSGQVLVPYIADPEQTDRLLHPTWSERHAELLGDSQLQVDGRKLACTEYDYSGGEYPVGTRFWLDAGDVMLRYCWQQDEKTRWQVDLADYEPAS